VAEAVRARPRTSALLRLIDERSTAFRAAVASRPSLDVQVPTCPEWTLFDLVQHMGEGRRSWAATVAAGPASAKSAAEGAPAAPRDPGRRLTPSVLRAVLVVIESGRVRASGVLAGGEAEGGAVAVLLHQELGRDP